MSMFPASPFGINPRRAGGRVAYVNTDDRTGQSTVNNYNYSQPMGVFNGSAPIGANAATAQPMFGGSYGGAPRMPQQPMPFMPPQQQQVNPSYSPPGGHSQNFLESVRRNNYARYSTEAGAARDPQYAQQLQAKAQNFAPPQGPTVVMPGSRGGQPFYLPSGANVVTPPGSSPRVAGHTVTDPDQLVKNPAWHEGSPATQPSFENPRPVPEFIKIRGGSHVDYGPDAGQQFSQQGGGNVAGHPFVAAPGATPGAAPAQPFAPQNNAQPSAGAGEQNHIQLTEQHARAMWSSLQNAYPNAPFETLRGQFKQMLGQYGVTPDMADHTLGRWVDQNSAQQTNFAQQQPAPAQQQPINMPLSMLGASNGMDPSQNYGASRQATPGPSIALPTAPQQQPQTQYALAPQGYSPLPQNGIAQRGGGQQQQPTTQPAAPTVVRSGTHNGRRVLQYSDGTIRDEQGNTL